MATRYQIWDKVSEVITPTGEVFSPSEWKNKYPMAKKDGIDLVIAGGTINGAFCNEYTSMVDVYDRSMRQSKLNGFTDGIPEGLTKNEVLKRIEEFEDAMNAASQNAVSNEERIVAALEAQVLMGM